MIHPNGRRPHSPDRNAAAPQLSRHLGTAAPPTACDRSNIPFTPTVYAGGEAPTCVLDGLVNLAAQVNAINNGTQLAIDETRIPTAFAAIDGCAPTLAAIMATDGLLMADVMAYQARGFDIGLQAPLTGLAGVLPLDRAVLGDGVARLGGVLVGVRLYTADMDAFARGLSWTGAVADAGALVGLHGLTLWDFAGLMDADLIRGATWARVQSFTVGWLAERLDEAWGWVSAEFASVGGVDIGVDFAALRAEQAQLMG